MHGGTIVAIVSKINPATFAMAAYNNLAVISLIFLQARITDCNCGKS